MTNFFIVNIDKHPTLSGMVLN